MTYPPTALSSPGIPRIQLECIVRPLVVDSDAVLHSYLRLFVAQLAGDFWQNLVVECRRQCEAGFGHELKRYIYQYQVLNIANVHKSRLTNEKFGVLLLAYFFRCVHACSGQQQCICTLLL